MTLLDSLRRRAAYNGWANRRLSAVLTDAHPQPVRWMAHVAAAERLWLRRIAGEQPASTTAEIWPHLDAGTCRQRVAAASQALAAFVDGLTEADLVAEAVYRNSAGKAYRTPVLDVLDHVLLHGQYHRGQANAALRAAGAEPVPVDFIVWVRETG